MLNSNSKSDRVRVGCVGFFVWGFSFMDVDVDVDMGLDMDALFIPSVRLSVCLSIVLLSPHGPLAHSGSTGLDWIGFEIDGLYIYFDRQRRENS